VLLSPDGNPNPTDESQIIFHKRATGR